MHKRRATGGKKKAWRKKRKCVPLSFIHFNIMNVFIYFNLVLFLFFCCLEFPNAVAESEGCVCIRFLVVLIGMMVRIFSWLFMAFDGLKLKVFFFLFLCFFFCVLEHMVDLGVAVLRVLVFVLLGEGERKGLLY